MVLQCSLSLFSSSKGESIQQIAKRSARYLYKINDTDENSLHNYLEFCGILALGEWADEDIVKIVPTEYDNRLLHVFKWDCVDNSDSFLDTVSYYTLQNNTDLKKQSLDDVVWVENDLVEIERRGYTLIAATLLLNVALPLEQDVELNPDVLGRKQVDLLPNEIKTALIQFMNQNVYDLLNMDNDNLAVDITDVPYKKDVCNNIATGYTHLGFGTNSGYNKHVFVHVTEETDDVCGVQFVIQTTCLVHERVTSDEPYNIVIEASLEALKCRFQQDFGVPNICSSINVYVAPGTTKLEDAAETETHNKPNKTKSNSKGGKNAKGKSASQRNRKPLSNKTPIKEDVLVELIKSGGPFEITLGNSKINIHLNMTLDKSSGRINVTKESGVTGNNEEIPERIVVNIVTKAFLPDLGSVGMIPFGGITTNLFDLLGSPNEHVLDEDPATNLKMILPAKELLDQSVLISPHENNAMFPQWISNKTGKATLVKGYYQYYHYMLGGINDSGWGCCYRSIQMVISWYALQYRTLKTVPTHAEIQKYLKEKDPSHEDMVIGSNKWIGTVEAGYFINWYLNYDTKTFYLSDVTEFRNYNILIAKHFDTVGSPIIMGAGMYAYVIIGICIGATSNDVAYLIADPHYVGDDNVKNIQTKGAVAWKKLDFISKAANGSFINLCCPLLDTYEK
eukprot:XP_001612028.1 protein of unknown function (DUF1671) protein family [Babesia bovis T2Bo]